MTPCNILCRIAGRHSVNGVAGAAGILIWGAKGSQDAKLPITVGPQVRKIHLFMRCMLQMQAVPDDTAT